MSVRQDIHNISVDLRRLVDIIETWTGVTKSRRQLYDELEPAGLDALSYDTIDPSTGRELELERQDMADYLSRGGDE